MKNLHFAILLVTLLSVFSAAAKSVSISPEKEKSYQRSIQQGCINDYKGPSGNKIKVCQCVAKNYIILSRGWAEKSQKEEILKHLSDFYNNKLSQKESDEDPYFLTDFIIGISDDCLKNSNYTLKKRP